MSMKTLKFLLLSLFLFFLIFLFIFSLIKENRTSKSVSSFEECVSLGYPVIETYPEKCIVKGKTFERYIGNEVEKNNLIQIEFPRPNDLVQSPLLIKGRARGYWFFEASFGVELRDEENNIISSGFAEAVLSEDETWMTEDFINFESELVFSEPITNKGTLVLKKDNPSGLPENDDSLVVPIIFINYD